jgi:hypothetical protein
MHEHVLHIELMDRPGMGDDWQKHHVDGGRLDHWAEGLIVVDTGPLGEVVKDLMSLVPLQGAIRVELMFEDPFAGDDIRANRMRDDIPSVVGDESIIFFLHGTTPGWVDEGNADGGGHQRER